MKNKKLNIWIALGVIFLFVYLAVFGCGGGIKGMRDMRFGIDIRGGVEAVFEPAGTKEKPTKAELEMAREVIETRLDAQNILDREVTADTDRGYVIVRFPWKSGETQFNPEVAIAELGEMANLTFRDEAGTIMLEGKDVSTSSPVESGGNGPRQYAVELHFTNGYFLAQFLSGRTNKEIRDSAGCLPPGSFFLPTGREP